MTNAEIKKLEDKIFPDFLEFVKRDKPDNKKFDGKSFLVSAEKMKKVWEKNNADTDIRTE